MACQLFQKSGSVNVVAHGYGTCDRYYDPNLYCGCTTYVWARVYNQTGSGQTRSVTAWAQAGGP